MIITLPTSDHCVYIARNIDLQVLYVGVTSHLFGRLHAHQAGSGWWARAHVIEVECFPSRAEADARETLLIRSLMPPGNDAGNPAVLMALEGVSIGDVRAFVAARERSAQPVPDGFVTLGEYAIARGWTIAKIRNDRARKPGFPEPVTQTGTTHRFRETDLDAFYQVED